VFFVYKWSQEFRKLSSAFNCIIDVFSVVELKKCVSVHLESWFIEILNLYFWFSLLYSVMSYAVLHFVPINFGIAY